MSKIIAICGKICCGKSYYAKQIKEKENAVILSIDEATYDLIDNEQGEFYNAFAEIVNKYLMKKAAMLSGIGAFGQKQKDRKQPNISINSVLMLSGIILV